MIKSFKEFLNESLSYSKMMKFNIDEFESGGIEEFGKEILKFLGDDKCLLADENGDEDELEVYNRIKGLLESAEIFKTTTDETSGYDYAHVIYYENFPVIGKLVSFTRGQSTTRAKASEEYMFFLPLSFRPQKFMESTKGFETGKQYGI